MKLDFERLIRFDQLVKKKVRGLLAGADEAGRGPLAGPVVGAVVIFPGESCPQGLHDSKKLSPARRRHLFWEILRSGLVGIGLVDVPTIERINIHQASLLAMKRAVLGLGRTPDFLLIDGRFTLDLPLPQRAVVRGDAKSASIAAASIIAKVYRDAWMSGLDLEYPGYAFSRHKGYGTREHMARIQSQGPCPEHRISFLSNVLAGNAWAVSPAGDQPCV